MVQEMHPSTDPVDMGTGALPGRHVLDIGVVRSLSQRSDLRGAIQFSTHLLMMLFTGVIVHECMGNWWLLLPAMVVHGFVIVTLFAPMHECVHRTAFASRMGNEIVGWFAGLLSFYNFTYYRYYHTWHHRYTQDESRDPELMSPPPSSVWQYLWEISAVPFWLHRPSLFIGLTFGRIGRYPFLPTSARLPAAISAGLQGTVYLAALMLIVLGDRFLWLYWLLPALLAQPLLRAILITEHTGCTTDANGLTNTRTTLTNRLVRLLMWNMPFHAEHHLYPSIPFHQLPQAHAELKKHLVNVAAGYIVANKAVVTTFMTLGMKEV